jgi:hypothetical protein
MGSEERSADGFLESNPKIADRPKTYSDMRSQSVL